MLSFLSRLWYIFGIILVLYNNDSSATEISESSHIIDSSLGFDVLLPVLICNMKFTGYKTISWYKDFTLLRNGSVDVRDHFLSLHSLLSNSEEIDNILKLQGYYWCKTEVPSDDHKYLFKIKRIHTYVGHFLATSDGLNKIPDFSLEDKILEKRMVYEREMEYILFGFLPMPNTFVHKVTQLGSGLKVYFFLYVQEPFMPRTPFAMDLIRDQHQLEFIDDYLHNNTDTDPDYYEEMTYWTNFRGISLSDIKLRSTIGCYINATLLPGEPPRVITWPYATVGETVIPEESCSSKDGTAVTRNCMGDFNSGAMWSVQYGKCDAEPEKLTVSLMELYNGFGRETGPVIIKKLKMLTQLPDLSVTDIHITINLLNELSKIPDLYQQDIDSLFSIIDNLLETDVSSLNVAKNTIQMSNRLLQIINNIMSASTAENIELQVTKPKLMAELKNTKSEDDHVIGISVMTAHSKIMKKNIDNTSFEFILNGTKFPHKQSMVYFLLPSELIMYRESYLMFPSQISLVLFKDWVLFPKAKGFILETDHVLLPTPVMYVGISGGPAFNLSDHVQLFFRDEHKRKIKHPICVSYDPRLTSGEGGWSTEGCSYAGLKNGFFQCRCNHLSIFAIILSHPRGQRAPFHMSSAVYAACGISILALAVAVLVYILSKIWRSTVDHHILFWLCLSFLCSLILLFTSEIESSWRPGCFLESIIFHYFILVTFSWLLIYSILHQVRFGRKTDTNEVPYFTLKCFIAAWGVPAIIMVVVALEKKYELHDHENCWPNVVEMSKVAFVPVVCILVLTFCINVSAGYALSCRFKKDFLVGDNQYNEPALKFRISVSIYFLFVLCWIFGYLALHKTDHELQILFSIVTIVTAYYVTLFFIFQEISFWDLCGKLKDKESAPVTNDVVAYNSKSYNSTETN